MGKEYRDKHRGGSNTGKRRRSRSRSAPRAERSTHKVDPSIRLNDPEFYKEIRALNINVSNNTSDEIKLAVANILKGISKNDLALFLTRAYQPSEFYLYMTIAHYYRHNNQYNDALNILNLIDPKNTNHIVIKTKAVCHQNLMHRTETIGLLAALCKVTRDQQKQKEIQLTIARSQEEMGMMHEAKLTFDALCKKYPKDERLLYSYSIFLSITDDLERASVIIQQLKLINPNNVSVRLFERRHHLSPTDHNSTLKEFDDILKSCRTNEERTETLFSKAKYCSEATKDIETALSIYKELHAHHPGIKKISIAYGILLHNLDRYTEAKTVFETIKTKDAEVLLSMGRCDMSLKNYDQAQAFFEEALTLCDHDGNREETNKILIAKAICYEKSGNPYPAAKILENLYLQAPHDKTIAMSYVIALEKIDHYSEAIAVLEKIDSTDTKLKLIWSRLYQKIRKFNKALQLIDDVIATCANDINQKNEAFLAKAYCLKAKGDNDLALVIFQSCYEQDHNNQTTALAYAIALKETNQYAKSLAVLLHITPHSVEILIEIGLCYTGLNEFELALKSFDDATKVRDAAESKNFIMRARAICHEKKKEHTQALNIHKKLVEDNPGDETILKNYIQFQKKYHSSNIETVDFLRRICRCHPNTTLLTEVMQLNNQISRFDETEELYFEARKRKILSLTVIDKAMDAMIRNDHQGNKKDKIISAVEDAINLIMSSHCVDRSEADQFMLTSIQEKYDRICSIEKAETTTELTQVEQNYPIPVLFNHNPYAIDIVCSNPIPISYQPEQNEREKKWVHYQIEGYILAAKFKRHAYFFDDTKHAFLAACDNNILHPDIISAYINFATQNRRYQEAKATYCLALNRNLIDINVVEAAMTLASNQADIMFAADIMNLCHNTGYLTLDITNKFLHLIKGLPEWIGGMHVLKRDVTRFLNPVDAEFIQPTIDNVIQQTHVHPQPSYQNPHRLLPPPNNPPSYQEAVKHANTYSKA